MYSSTDIVGKRGIGRVMIFGIGLVPDSITL